MSNELAGLDAGRHARPVQLRSTAYRRTTPMPGPLGRRGRLGYVHMSTQEHQPTS